MGIKVLEDTLKDFGLTDKETEVYLFLAKKGAQKISQIAKALRTNKGLVYRIMKNLEQKALVEVTLESPTRYIAVSLEQIIDEQIQSKREEASRVEDIKQDLLSDWKKIKPTNLEPQMEKFSVIEGEKKIFQKIRQMIRETKKELASIVTVNGLLHAEKYDVFDTILNHPFRSEIEFRYITKVDQGNIASLKFILDKLNSVFSLKGKNPDLDDHLFPRLVIRDNEEILLFINDQTKTNPIMPIGTVLSTNCKSIIKSFYSFFEELWKKSLDINTIVNKIENSEKIQPFVPIKPSDINHEEILKSAEKEVVILTSSSGLIELKNKLPLLKSCSKRGIDLKIMAPITTENIKVANEFSQYFEVRHVPVTYLKTAIIDKKHLFQERATFENDNSTIPNFHKTLYTNDYSYISDRIKVLNNLWKTSKPPSMVTLDSIANYSKSNLSSRPSRFLENTIKKIESPIVVKEDYSSLKRLTENEIIALNLNAERHPETSFVGGITRYYGFVGQAIVRPNNDLNLPEMLFIFLHCKKNSRFGIDNILQVFVKRKSSDQNFLPVVYISDNKKKLDFHKMTFAGCFLNDNFVLAKKGQITIHMNEKRAFCGWSMEIPLIDDYILPASSIILKGFGKTKPSIFELQYPSGYRLWNAYNGIEAFVNYFNPSTNYLGPSTDGLILKDNYLELCEP